MRCCPRCRVSWGGWPESLVNQPAAWSVPLALTTMVVLSRLTPHRAPRDIIGKMLALHTHERLGLARALRE